jgi:hypothetical protein
MNVNGFKGYERCDENALLRWENEGGCVGLRLQPRLTEPTSARHDLVAMRNGRTAVPEGSSARNLKHRYGTDDQLPRRDKVLVAATVWA